MMYFLKLQSHKCVTMVKRMYVLKETPVFVLGLMKGINLNIPTEFQRKTKQVGQS